MKNRWSLKGQDKGASLMAVLVALIFVGIISVVILNVTIANIQMREVEQSGKENFYGAEGVMDELTIGINDIASGAMERAYTTILADYRDIMVNGSDIQDKFARLYMYELEQAFLDPTQPVQKNPDPADVSTVTYEIGHYDEDIMKGCLSDANKGYLWYIAEDATFHVDYTEGRFTLQKVGVSYIDSEGYETSIQTDMVFYTPELNFDGSNVIMEYMRYSIISDDSVEIGAGGINVQGNVYAGTGGIYSVSPGTATISGDTIVTRGDISVDSGSSMTIGNDASRVWAENITTSGKGDESFLDISGNIDVADDLALNGKKSTVTLHGNYYGYNFQDKYDAVRNVADASFSSAMMINATNSKINMSDLNYLLLSGRTYISRGSKGNTQNSDIMLGESVSVRTNQFAYYIPANYVDATDTANIKFADGQKAAYEAYIGVSNISSYLDTAKPIVPYYFKDSGISSTRYYLNFASEQKANDFFAAYYAANSGKVNALVDSYAGDDAIILDDGTLYTLKGDMMYQTSAGAPISEQKVTISGDQWEPGTSPAEANGVYWEYANRLAINYKCLQMYLEDSHTGISTDDVRFEDGSGNVDKTITPLVDNIMDVAAIQADYPVVSGTSGIVEQVLEERSPTDKTVVVIVNNESAGTPYTIPMDFKEGIIIATGNVTVQGNFKGMIIAKGKINFLSGATVTADELLVSRLFKEDKALETPLFANYFPTYNTYADSVIGTIKVDEYLVYENWTKNRE